MPRPSVSPDLHSSPIVFRPEASRTVSGTAFLIGARGSAPAGKAIAGILTRLSVHRMSGYVLSWRVVSFIWKVSIVCWNKYSLMVLCTIAGISWISLHVQMVSAG